MVSQTQNKNTAPSKLFGSVEHEVSGPAGTFQIRKTGGTVEYVSEQGTVYHPVTYHLVKKTGRKGLVLLSENPGRGARTWLEAARQMVEGMAAGAQITPQAAAQDAPEPVKAEPPAASPREPAPVSDANPYEVISEQIAPTLEVISASKALLAAMDRAGVADPDFDHCVRGGLERLRLKLADQLVERTSGGWFSAR